MNYVWLMVALAAVIAAIAAGRLFVMWIRFRGDRVITCPENQRPAGVRLDARQAALGTFGKEPRLRLETCTRWPERSGCGQQCLRQIEEAPESCLVRNILLEWYRGKSCCYCGNPLDMESAKNALLPADKVSRECWQIPVEELPATLETALPVCFACHLANTLVRERPDLVTDRSGRYSA